MTIVVGSIEALMGVVAGGELLGLHRTSDVVIVPTAAAFTGITEAAVALSAVFDDIEVNVEALMIGDRQACEEPYFANRMRIADVVLLSDGSALHAKSVWRDTPVGEAIRDARCLIAIGSCASVLGEVMIDPRGGAPMIGLGYRTGLAITTSASEEQLTRTRSLLGADTTLAVLGPQGVVTFDGTTWDYGADVVVSRGGAIVER